MSSKTFFVFCAGALLIQSVLSQCTSPAAVAVGPGMAGPYGLAGAGLGYNGLAGPYGFGAPALAAPGISGIVGPMAYDGLYTPAIEFTSTSSGGLAVTSASAIPPTGITVVSENAFEGILSVVGEVPFVGTSGMEGVLPTAGAGLVNHACGNGATAMSSDGIVPAVAGFPPAAAIAPAFAGYTPAAAAFAPGLAGLPNAAYGSCGRGLVL